jgi:hypothetical protein
VPRCEQSGELDSKTFNILVGQKPRRVHSRVSDASATRATRNGTVSCSTFLAVLGIIAGNPVVGDHLAADGTPEEFRQS